MVSPRDTRRHIQDHGTSALEETQEGDLLLEEDSAPQTTVFCLSLDTIIHIYTLSHSPPLLSAYFCLGQYFFCASHSCTVGRGHSSTSGEAEERLVTSLRKSCNCSFLSLLLSAGAYMCNPRYGCLTSPSSSSQMWHTEIGERIRNIA